jgi:hypothetical protein
LNILRAIIVGLSFLYTITKSTAFDILRKLELRCVESIALTIFPFSNGSVNLRYQRGNQKL